jgi:putative transcriptional regulator
LEPPRRDDGRKRHAAALLDPDARPLDADMDRMKQTPRVKIVRRARGLTQEEFAARFMIPIGTLRDWEQGRVEPDRPARVFFSVIAVDARQCSGRWRVGRRK